MRRRSRGGRSTGSLRRAFCACPIALACLAIGCPSPPSANADSCSNARSRGGPSERLPDCRVYEQASPVETGGVDAVTLQPLYPAQASTCEEGEACAVVYMNDAAAFAGAQGNESPNAYLATRGSGGWQTTPLTPPTLQPPANGFATVSYAFSADLSRAVLRVPLQRLTESAPSGVYNLFLRNPAGSYALVTASVPASPPQPGCGGCFQLEDVPAFAGASSDFSHVIFEANDSLEGAPGGAVANLYETVFEPGREPERVRLVGILPDGVVASQGATPGGGISPTTQHAGELDNAISQNGSQILFQAVADGGLPDPQQVGKTELYDRLGGASTVEVSAPAPGAEPSKCETPGGLCQSEAAQFWAASTDGSVVFFTSKAALTKESFTGSEHAGGENAGNDLYRYEVGSGALTDLTVDVGNPADASGAGVLGVVGSSNDGSYVYFVADGKLADGAESGQPNLYVWHGSPAGSGGQVKFIATLAPADEEEESNIEHERVGPIFANHSDIADWAGRPKESQAYVTPDGRHLAFMSVARLTGYDNEDQLTHEADHEVFEYGAETGQLACASCDPGGARPLGSAFIGAELTERMSTPFHQPRTLSDDGSRLFFSSPDPLVPGLSGGSVKVFEYEDGAVQPISGTGSGSDDVFLDASASGNDVFFASREQLTLTDGGELVEVYDARVGGGFPTPPTLPPSCQAGDCPTSPAPSFSTPLSVSYAGPGNTPQPKAKPTNAQLLARALAACRKQRNRHKRAACVKTAKRRYGPRAKRSRRTAAPARRRRRAQAR